MNSTYVVEMKNITKDFAGTKVLKNVDLSILRGEIHALIGENGAGKSTIIKILTGAISKTSGEIYINGQSVDIKSPSDSQSFGLGVVYQDINLAQHLSIAENFFMGKLPVKSTGLIDYKKMYEETENILSSIDININPKLKINKLSIAQQEMITIGKMLHQKVQLVIFDEPTALLTEMETKQLFKIIKMLKEQNVGVLYVSHRMEEIISICNRVTVFKDGINIHTLDNEGLTQDDLFTMMVGRKSQDVYNIKMDKNATSDILQVESISRKGHFQNISFNVKKGEIFGMFGLVGSGRTEIVRSVFGADTKDCGNVYVNGNLINPKNPKDGIDAGIALLPENRKEQGLCLKLSVLINTNMVNIKKISKYGLINNVRGKKIAKKYCEELQTKCTSINQSCEKLSGGNQQKVVISKWLSKDSELFIFDEPTVGVDVGAKGEIYKIFEDLISKGKSIILISSYLPEVMGLTNRLLIMHKGKQMRILNKNEYDEKNILKLASGIVD